MAGEGKVLSQSEIDALLSAFSDDETGAEITTATQVQVAARPIPQNVRIYDFRRPAKFLKSNSARSPVSTNPSPASSPPP